MNVVSQKLREKDISVRRDRRTIKGYQELKCDKDDRVFIDATDIAIPITLEDIHCNE